jgi:hypothetical protein
VGSQLAATSSVSVEIDFFPLNGTGSYVSYWQIWSDGGNVNTVLEGIASTAPVANFSISTTEGGWLPPSELTMDFGDVAPGSSSSLQIRICNEGGSSLSIDKSKPPFGVFHISDPEELAETQIIAPGDCAYGTVLFNPNTEEYDIPNYAVNNTWTLNTNDLNFGVHVVEIVGTVVDATVGPVNSTTGETIYQYLGWYVLFHGSELRYCSKVKRVLIFYTALQSQRLDLAYSRMNLFLLATRMITAIARLNVTERRNMLLRVLNMRTSVGVG